MSKGFRSLYENRRGIGQLKGFIRVLGSEGVYLGFAQIRMSLPMFIDLRKKAKGRKGLKT